MSPQKGTTRPGECSIDMPFTCQEEVSICKVPKAFTDRCPSQSSSLNSNSGDICRICHCEGGPELPLITPCYCSGSLRYVHQNCLQQWIKSSNIRCCELCKFQFIMQTKVKPFNEWEYLEMSGIERKKLVCAMLFHIIAMTCVCWSLYVLIDRTLDEVRKGHLEWPFWTKLIVVGIGFMGGIVFMYIQCRAYFVLCKRWKAYNRVIYVQNAPEKCNPQATKLLASSTERDGGPSCSFRPYSDTCKRDNVPETSCIDIKGVRNLHIIFGEENQIRFHRDGVHGKRALTQGEHCEDATRCLKDKNNHVYENTSLHIQIGGNSDRGCNISSGINVNDGNAYGTALCPADCKKDQDTKVEKFATKNEFKADQSVVKLQFKKAEIVIEFGKNNAKEMKFSSRTADKSGWNGVEAGHSPKRRFSSEEYLDLDTKYRDKVANETNELPTSKLLINGRNKVPFNNFFRDKALVKDWKSSEDLLVVNNAPSIKF